MDHKHILLKNMITNTYTYGETITLTATPDDCCEFLYWVDSSNPCLPLSYESEFVVTANSNITYIPVFKKKRFLVNVTANLPNYCCITGNGWYDCGDDVTITVVTASCNGISWADAALNVESEFNDDVISNTQTLTYTIGGISEDFEEMINITLCMCKLSVSMCQDTSENSSVIILTASNTPNHHTTQYICGGHETEPINPCDYEEVVIHHDTLYAPCGTEVTLIATTGNGDIFKGWKNGNNCADCSNILPPYVNEQPVFTFVLENDIDYIACFN